MTMSPSSDRWLSISPQRRNIVMWGAADQGRVNRYILEALGCRIVVVVDDTVGRTSPFSSVPLLSGQTEFESWLAGQAVSELGFVAAIGNPYGHIRCKLHDVAVMRGLAPVSFADPSALLCKSARYGDGLQIMPHAIVHNEVTIARQCILNTRSIVEHDCVLSEGVEIGPGAVLCGRVEVGANTWIGAGSTVRQRARIGRDCIIGAGSTVVSDIPDRVVAYGNPARPVKKNDVQWQSSRDGAVT